MLAAPVSGGIVGVGVGFFGCPPGKTSSPKLVLLFPVLPPGTHGFAGGTLPFCGRLLRPSILAFGDYTYEIKGVVGQTEYELRVDAETEEILKEDSENNDHDDDGYLSFGNLITPAEAIRIAQERINTDASAFEGWKLDNNDDHGNAPVYEVEFQGHDAEVKIHAETGEVLGVDG